MFIKLLRDSSAPRSIAGIAALSALLGLVGCVEAPPPRPRPPPPPAYVGPPPNTTVYAYPQQGQSPDQQSRDRYECTTWAVNQTGFDPSAPNVPPQYRVVASGPPPGTGTASDASRAQNNAIAASEAQQQQAAAMSQKAYDYRRALSACLSGRGYSVK